MQTLNQILAAIGLQILHTPTGVTRNHLCDAQIHIMAAMGPCAIEHLAGTAACSFADQIQTIILEAVDSNGEMTLNQIYELIEGNECGCWSTQSVFAESSETPSILAC